MLEDDCRYLMVSKIPTVGISLKAQTEINGLLEGYLRHFSANQPEGLELLDVAQCCYKLTTKKLCVELQPDRLLKVIAHVLRFFAIGLFSFLSHHR